MKDPFTASLEFRRRYIRDLTWLGLALIAMGFGILTQMHGWARLWSALFWIVGCSMVAPAVGKWLRKGR